MKQCSLELHRSPLAVSSHHPGGSLGHSVISDRTEGPLRFVTFGLVSMSILEDTTQTMDVTGTW
jgi:hypothetical protein